MTSLCRAVAAIAVVVVTTGCWPVEESKAPPAVAAPSAPATTAPTTTAPPPPSTSLSGTWAGTWANQVPDQSTGSFTVTWTQNGNALTGSITISGTPCLSGGSITGSVNGATISFGAVQGQVTVEYSGTVASTTMSGTYATDCGKARGSWTATRK
jgi:hypothetical protein